HNRNPLGLKLSGFATVEDNADEGEIIMETSEIGILDENTSDSNLNKKWNKKLGRRGSFDISETGTFMARDFIIGETGVKGAPQPRARGNSDSTDPNTNNYNNNTSTNNSNSHNN